jgi:lycopene beta-cyclase
MACMATMRDGLLIAGGGLAGSLAALAMAKSRPEVPLLLIDEKESFGGDHVWWFYEDDVDEADRWLIEPLIEKSWPGFYVAFPGRSRKFKAPVSCIRSRAVDQAVREALRPDQYRLGTKAVAVRENELVLLGGERIKAGGAIDARGAANLSMLELGWHKSFGREYSFAAPHRVDRPVLVDATVEQGGAFRFMRCLPFSDTRLLVEDVEYSEAAEIDTAASAARLDNYLATRKWEPLSVEREEERVLPVAMGGDFGAFWRVGGARVAKIGLRGGFFHPTSGHSVGDAVRNAITLTQQKDFGGEPLHDLFEEEAAAAWRKRDLMRGFNATLFAAKGDERRRHMEDFYQLDPALIARFQGGKTGLLDKMRLGKLVR